MNGRTWAWLRVAAGAVVLGVVVWWTGSGPFLHGLRAVDGGALAAGVAIAVPTTVACAWRWHLVSRGLGVGVALRPAVGSYYRSQFLNTTLPGGVLGDVHRGVHHGRTAGDTGRGLRAVAWERLAGQVVQVVLAAAVLLLLPSPVRSAAPTLAAGLAVVAAVAVVALALSRRTHAGGASPWARALRVARCDVRTGLLGRRIWPGVALASTVAVAGHVATYLVAAHATGVTASPTRLVPLALLVLLAMGIPTNLAGWGPREGVAAWAFGAAGLGAGEGVATTVVYGVMVLVASLPGAVVLVAAWLRGSSWARSEASTGRAGSPEIPPEIAPATTPSAAGGGRHG